MFCENCGTKLEKDTQFCQSCGRKVGDVSITPKISQTAPVDIAEFYSEDWQRKKVFAIASLPYFDVMIDKKNLYIIQMPKYGGQTLGLILGLILLNLIGAVIGSSIGSSSDSKKRKWYRSAWVKDGQITSSEFSNDIFLKVPLENLKQSIVLGKNKFTLTYDEESIILKKGQKEFDRLYQSIKKYVL